MSDLVVRATDDAGAIAVLRSFWSGASSDDFAARMAAWLEAEGDRATACSCGPAARSELRH